MDNFGILELILLVVLILSVVVIILSIYKLIKCKLPLSEKVLYGILICIFSIIGSVIFLIYHDRYLETEKRA